MFKPFFLHVNPYSPGRLKGLLARGATAYITPVSTDNGFTPCYVQIAYCSPKDQFCRRTGREEALKKQPERVFIKDLPKYLSETVGLRVHGFVAERMFQHVWKNFL